MPYQALYRWLWVFFALASTAAAADVVLMDHKSRTRTVVPLPEWVVGGEAYVCAPDLAIGPKGEAVVSSNVLPVLWRIDPVTLKVSRHELVIDAHAGKDIGLTGLA